ncbi:MAG TPA: aminopeptidase [Candidatus Coprenecus stercorigallinarum]|nr:aminopeptidase [Candidatus Coprenecus stercorigallinarum]
MKLHYIIAGALALAMAIPSQAEPKKKQQEPEKVNPYQFTEVVRIPVTPVKDQNATGTCWCFASTSFIEAELMRMGKGEYDLSELFTVRHNYYERMDDNYLRRGKGNIGEGSIAHMTLNIIDKYGIVPQSAYSGINYDSPLPNHRELGTYLRAIAEGSVKLKARSPEYWELQDALFDIYMGKLPETFVYEGKEYTPITFRDMLGINTDDYIEITSFSHHPFYQEVPLEIPDNWDHALLYNLPLDEMMEVIDNALNNGYTVCWDGDVSEKGYVYSPLGVAILPADATLDRQAIAATDTLIAEVENVDQALRQKYYESFTTTDDHLEHLTGIATDPAGTKYYITKNSWGAEGPYDGYHYMSEKYIKGKTVSILVHKDAIPAAIRAKLGL